MAKNKKPSIYSDRSSIGSAEELDEYGVWVKSGPQILDSDNLSSDLDTDGLSADDFAETDLSFDDAILDVKTEGGDGFGDIDFPDDDIEIDSGENNADLDLGEYNFKEDSIQEESGDDGLNIEEAQFEDFQTPEDTPQASAEETQDFDSLDIPSADPLDDNLIDESFDISLDDIATDSEGEDALDSADLSIEDDSLSILTNDDLGTIDAEFSDNAEVDAAGDDSAINDMEFSDIDLENKEPSGDSNPVDINLNDDSANFLPDEAGFSGSDDIDIPTVKSIENNALNIEKNFDAVQSNAGGDLSSILLQKIANELSSIRNELTDLKKEFAIARSGIQDSAKAASKEASPQQQAAGFFTEEDDETISLTGDELNNILATGESIEEQGVPEKFDADESVSVTLDDDDDDTIALTGDELNNIIATSDETVEEQGIPEKLDEDEGVSVTLDDDDDETIALTGDELDNIVSSADFTEEAGTDVAAENEIPADIDEGLTIDEELLNADINAIDLQDDKILESDEALDAIDADSFDMDVTLDENIDIDIPLDDEDLSDENIDVDIPLPEETGSAREEPSSLEDSISASIDDAIAEPHDDDIVFDAPILCEDLDLSFDNLDVQADDNEDAAEETDIPDINLTESIEIDDSIFSDMDLDDAAAGLSDNEEKEDVSVDLDLDTEDSDIKPDDSESETSDIDISALGDADAFDNIVISEELNDDSSDSLNEAIEAADALAVEDEVVILDGLEVFREEGIEHMTETPDNISYLEDSETADNFTADDFDLSDAVIDEPELSADNIKDDLTEPAINESDIDLDALNDLTIETPLDEQEISLDVPSEDDFPSEEIDIGNFLEDELGQQAEEEVEDEPPVPQVDTSIDSQTAVPVQESAGISSDKPISGAKAAPVNEARPQAVPGRQTAGKDFQIPSELKSELRNILSYMDQLLESLPEEKIEEFAKSNYFDSYKKLFKDLGLV